MRHLLTLLLGLFLFMADALAQNQTVGMSPAPVDPNDAPPFRRSVALCPQATVTDGNLLIVSNVAASSTIEVELIDDDGTVFTTLLEDNLTTQLPPLEPGKQYTLLLRINGIYWIGYFIKI